MNDRTADRQGYGGWVVLAAAAVALVVGLVSGALLGGASGFLVGRASAALGRPDAEIRIERQAGPTPRIEVIPLTPGVPDLGPNAPLEPGLEELLEQMPPEMRERFRNMLRRRGDDSDA